MPLSNLPPLRPWWCLAHEESSQIPMSGSISVEASSRVAWWDTFLCDPPQWWDNKRNPSHLDLNYRRPRNSLWFDPVSASVGGELRPGTIKSTGRASHLPGFDHGANQKLSRRVGSFEEVVQVGICSEVFVEAQLSDAVQALGLLVKTQSYIENSIFYGVLRRCILQKDLVLGIRVHELAVSSGYESNAFLANHIICMYASHGRLEEAMSAFWKVPAPSRYMWASIILAHARHGKAKQAIKLYLQMRKSRVKPDNHIFVAVLKACASAVDLLSGREVHADILGLAANPSLFVGNCLVDMYSKCGSLDDARRLFDNLPARDVVTWNAMIAGYAHHGLGQDALALYDRMQQEGITIADSITFVSLLQACASAEAVHQGKQLHAEIQKLGLEADMAIGNCLINMYAKCGCTDDARKVFDGLSTKDVVTWNTMIGGYAQHGQGLEALSLYGIMQLEGITSANAVTYVCLLQACGSVAALEKGKEIHSQISQAGLETSNAFVGNALINMYAKCRSLEDARRVFDNSPDRDVVTWTTMITGYAQCGLGHEALALHASMEQEGVSLDDAVAFMCLLQACTNVGALRRGRELHKQILEKKLETDLVIGTCLVDMYSKCGDVEEARYVFDNLQVRDVVTWNAMIAGYVQHGYSHEALSLYETMQLEDIIQADAVTFGCLLQACGRVTGLEKGKEIHAHICKVGLEAADSALGNALIDMYGNCGSMVDAQLLFDAFTRRDTVTWSALIAGYARQGESDVVFALLQRMKQDGIQPNSVTFLSVLTVCSHVGLLDQGQQYFQAMSRDFKRSPTIEHYNCMIDMFGRAGQLDRAMEILTTMPFQPTIEVWRCVLSACRKWNNVQLGRQAFECAVGLDKNDAAAYVLMANIYENAGMQEQAKAVQAKRVKAQAWKMPGQSWSDEIGGMVHTFVVGDGKQTDKEHLSDYARA